MHLKEENTALPYLRDVPRNKIQTELFYLGVHINTLKRSMHGPWGYYFGTGFRKKGGAHLCFNPKGLVFELSKGSCQKGWQMYREQGYWDAAVPQQWRID